MGKITSNITRASYMMKRLRDSGYRVDKVMGVSDLNSLKIDRDKLLNKLFPKEKPFYHDDIVKVFDEFTTEILSTIKATPNYADHDSRVWTILIDGGVGNIFLTFYRNSKDSDEQYEGFGEDYFEIFDGGQFIKPLRKRLNTHSFEVIVQELNNLGISKFTPN